MTPTLCNLGKVAAASLLLMATPVLCQSPTLGIGSPAPALQVKWIKGEPVSSFDNGKIYILEFWATWCGPCRAAMPHLSELARANSGKVVVVGVNVFERGSKDKAYESHYPAVKAFVDKMGNDMDYRVAMDLNDRPMAKQWMAAAGQEGIPASFVVKDGRILWVGHPGGLDKVLEEIKKGTYDLTGNAQKLKQDAEERRVSNQFLDKLEADLNAAMAAKDYKKALALLESGSPRLDPSSTFVYRFMKISTLLKFDVPKALAAAHEASEKESSVGAMLAVALLHSEEELPLEAYPWCQEQVENLVKKPGPPNPIAYHLIALCKAKKQDFSGAVASEEKALEIAKAALAAGEQKERVTAETVLEYQAALEKYKASVTPEIKPNAR